MIFYFPWCFVTYLPADKVTLYRHFSMSKLKSKNTVHMKVGSTSFVDVNGFIPTSGTDVETTSSTSFVDIVS